jgi:PhnB protein
MHAIPYLFFNGRCKEAIAFYKKAIGATGDTLMRYADSPDKSVCTEANKDMVMHAEFKVGDTAIFASDGMGKGELKFDGFSLAIAAEKESEAERMFNALCDGGAVVMAMSETFFAKRFGMARDKFGMNWMIIVQKTQ